MQFEFNTIIDKTNCHIRAARNYIVENEVIIDKPHKHYSMEFHCVFKGEEIINFPHLNKQINLSAGKILLIPAEIYHGVITENQSVERLCFNFSAYPVEKKITPVINLFLSIKEPTVFSGEETQAMLRQARQVFSQNSGSLPKLRQGIQLMNIAVNLMCGVSREQIKISSTDSIFLKQRWIIEDYIQQHFTDNSGIKGLAKALYLSERQTSTLVKKFMGENYKSVIIKRRMELAEIFLQNPNKSLDDIAYETGYRSYSGFELCFKKYFGTTPAEKRAQTLKNKGKGEINVESN